MSADAYKNALCGQHFTKSFKNHLNNLITAARLAQDFETQWKGLVCFCSPGLVQVCTLWA